VLRGGDVALEIGVCALETSRREENTESSSFVIKEPLVIRAFSDLPALEFELISNESPARIGMMFEDYIALNAKHIIDGIMQFSETQIKSNAGFKGPWQLASANGDECLGIGSEDGEEPHHIRTILACAGEKGPFIVFPSTSLGADIVIAAKRPNGYNKLLLFIQVKACMQTSTQSAMNSLKYPYHQNRDKKPKVPENKKASLEQLNTVLTQNNVHVVHVVVKYPADSKKGTHRTRMDGNLLRVIFDRSNAEKNLPALSAGLTALLEVKSMFRDET